MSGPTPGLIPNFTGAFGNTLTRDPIVDQSTHELQSVIIGVNTNKITVSTTPPVSPSTNDIWIDIS